MHFQIMFFSQKKPTDYVVYERRGFFRLFIVIGILFPDLNICFLVLRYLYEHQNIQTLILTGILSFCLKWKLQ